MAIALLLVACGGDAKGAPKPSTGSTPPAASGTTPADDAGRIAGCGPAGSAIAGIERSGRRSFSSPPQRIIDPAKTYVATIETSKGVITIDLAASGAPITVNSFVVLSCTGFYDGLTFHRYEPGFVIQGGDPRGDGTGGPGYIYQNEISGLRHDAAGVVAMANAGVNTNGSQFYITLAATPNLDQGNPPGSRFTVFGRVSNGLDVVQALRRNDRIDRISIEER
jgi:cyclophilin family peptidyl-prolyl cis-trans isomerase